MGSGRMVRGVQVQESVDRAFHLVEVTFNFCHAPVQSLDTAIDLRRGDKLCVGTEPVHD